MPKPYSEDLRERVIEAVESIPAGGGRELPAEPEFGGEMVAALARYWKRQSEAQRRGQVAFGGACGIGPGPGRRATGIHDARDSDRESQTTQPRPPHHAPPDPP